MYNLNKMIILKSGNSFYAMITHGLKVISILYIQQSKISNKEDIKNDLRSELYSDQYGDDLKIKVKESLNIEDSIIKLCKYISKNWEYDMQIYFYNPEAEFMEKIKDSLLNIDGSIYVFEYHDIFVDKYSIDKDIFTIMKENGLKTENMIKDSQISFIYFLSALVEVLLSR